MAKKMKGGDDTFALSKYFFWVPGTFFLLIIALLVIFGSKLKI